MLQAADSLDGTTKRIIAENEALVAELAYQSGEAERLTKLNTIFMSENTEVKRELSLSQEEVRELFRRTNALTSALRETRSKLAAAVVAQPIPESYNGAGDTVLSAASATLQRASTVSSSTQQHTRQQQQRLNTSHGSSSGPGLVLGPGGRTVPRYTHPSMVEKIRLPAGVASKMRLAQQREERSSRQQQQQQQQLPLDDASTGMTTQSSSASVPQQAYDGFSGQPAPLPPQPSASAGTGEPISAPSSQWVLPPPQLHQPSSFSPSNSSSRPNTSSGVLASASSMRGGSAGYLGVGGDAIDRLQSELSATKAELSLARSDLDSALDALVVLDSQRLEMLSLADDTVLSLMRASAELRPLISAAAVEVAEREATGIAAAGSAAAMSMAMGAGIAASSTANSGSNNLVENRHTIAPIFIEAVQSLLTDALAAADRVAGPGGYGSGANPSSGHNTARRSSRRPSGAASQLNTVRRGSGIDGGPSIASVGGGSVVNGGGGGTGAASVIAEAIAAGENAVVGAGAAASEHGSMTARHAARIATSAEVQSVFRFMLFLSLRMRGYLNDLQRAIPEPMSVDGLLKIGSGAHSNYNARLASSTAASDPVAARGAVASEPVSKVLVKRAAREDDDEDRSDRQHQQHPQLSDSEADDRYHGHQHHHQQQMHQYSSVPRTALEAAVSRRSAREGHRARNNTNSSGAPRQQYPEGKAGDSDAQQQHQLHPYTSSSSVPLIPRYNAYVHATSSEVTVDLPSLAPIDLSMPVPAYSARSQHAVGMGSAAQQLQQHHLHAQSQYQVPTPRAKYQQHVQQQQAQQQLPAFSPARLPNSNRSSRDSSGAYAFDGNRPGLDGEHQQHYSDVDVTAGSIAVGIEDDQDQQQQGWYQDYLHEQQQQQQANAAASNQAQRPESQYGATGLLPGSKRPHLFGLKSSSLKPILPNGYPQPVPSSGTSVGQTSAHGHGSGTSGMNPGGSSASQPGSYASDEYARQNGYATVTNSGSGSFSARPSTSNSSAGNGGGAASATGSSAAPVMARAMVASR